MEFAMMDALAHECLSRGIKTIIGYYYPTAKNHMVETFYDMQGFSKISEDAEGNTEWKLELSEGYVNKNNHIKTED